MRIAAGCAQVRHFRVPATANSGDYALRNWFIVGGGGLGPRSPSDPAVSISDKPTAAYHWACLSQSASQASCLSACWAQMWV
jgi:hypothetical protein